MSRPRGHLEVHKVEYWHHMRILNRRESFGLHSCDLNGLDRFNGRFTDALEEFPYLDQLKIGYEN